VIKRGLKKPCAIVAVTLTGYFGVPQLRDMVMNRSQCAQPKAERPQVAPEAKVQNP
jgi:hypothetical protein